MTAPGPLRFIVFDEDEFVKWQCKTRRRREVRWNGSGRERRFSGLEASLAKAEACSSVEDSDDEDMDSEEETWRAIVGDGDLEGMRMGTTLRMPRLAMNL